MGGEGDPTVLAGLRHPRLACPHEELIATLDGRLRDHHRFLIGQHLKTIEQIEAMIAEFDARPEVRHRRLFVMSLSDSKGIRVSYAVAQTLIAEAATDMSAFPTATTWLPGGMCRAPRPEARPKVLEASVERRALAGAGSGASGIVVTKVKS